MHPLKQIRLSLGLSQAEFGRALGVTQGHISYVERGQEKLGGRTALKAADLWRQQMARLGITVEDLIRGSREAGDPQPAA